MVMKATFTKAALYHVEATCQTPLRTGGTGGDTELVLRDRQGNAIIQGSSLAGAFRSWLEHTEATAMAERLFGSQERSGHLMVSDGVFDKAAEQVLRPRLRIDPRTGSADPSGKFDVAHIAAGSRFVFSLTWLGGEEAEEMSAVEELLAALHSGEIRLGAQKSNGFGRVALSVRKQGYDLCRGEDRAAWLEDREDGQPLTLPEISRGEQVVFTVVGQADNVLVRGASSEHTEDSSITRNLQEAGRPVIPGSSIKGAVRARAALIARWKNWPAEEIDRVFGRETGPEDNGMAGKVLFEDAYLSSDRTRKISRIRINRFTAGVIRGGLFTEEPVCSKLQLRITAPAEYKLVCGLLVYALRDLALGLYSFGSGTAIGRGRIQVETIRIETPGKQPAELRFDTERQCAVTDPAGIIRDWLGQEVQA